MGEKDKKEIKKQEKIPEDNSEKIIVIGEVVENFIKEEPRELSQEEEIENFRLKKIKEQYNFSTEEREKKEEAERKEEEELEKQKRELLISLTQRIPAIEKRIYGQAQNKKENLKVKASAEKSVTREEKEKEQVDKNNIEQSKGFERE